jgi:parallel beta-helix repeat protein
MNEKYGILIICAAISFLCFVGAASATTWSVDGSGEADLTGIHDAINNASTGDTILVYSSVYYENVVVDKSVSLRGIGQPVVDGRRSGSAVTLTAEGITLEGFNVTNAGSLSGNAGIKVISNHNNITGNNVSNNKDGGICLCNSSNNTITGNTASNN